MDNPYSLWISDSNSLDIRIGFATSIPVTFTGSHTGGRNKGQDYLHCTPVYWALTSPSNRASGQCQAARRLMGNQCLQLKVRSEFTPNPVTGLTPKDREYIMKSWAKVVKKPKLSENATNFFILLFKEYPYMIDYFAQFKGKTVEELSGSSALRAHGIRVFFAISAYVESMDEPTTLISLVEKVSKRHYALNVHVTDMDNLKGVFLTFMRGNLPKRDNKEVLKSWDRFLTLHNSIFKTTQDKLVASDKRVIND